MFYRDVDDYIQSTIAPQTINGIVYQVTEPTNAPSGKIKGAEVGYTQFLDFLPGIWSGFGIQANATYVDGPFQNISKWSYNLIGIYEKGPASVRVAYNWRSGFNVGPAPGGGMQPARRLMRIRSLGSTCRRAITCWRSSTRDLRRNELVEQLLSGLLRLALRFPQDTRRFDRTYPSGSGTVCRTRVTPPMLHKDAAFRAGFRRVLSRRVLLRAVAPEERICSAGRRDCSRTAVCGFRGGRR